MGKLHGVELNSQEAAFCDDIRGSLVAARLYIKKMKLREGGPPGSTEAGRQALLLEIDTLWQQHCAGVTTRVTSGHGSGGETRESESDKE